MRPKCSRRCGPGIHTSLRMDVAWEFMCSWILATLELFNGRKEAIDGRVAWRRNQLKSTLPVTGLITGTAIDTLLGIGEAIDEFDVEDTLKEIGASIQDLLHILVVHLANITPVLDLVLCEDSCRHCGCKERGKSEIQSITGIFTIGRILLHTQGGCLS